ncbi:unnamed protein product [Clonostachys byssicola]|uniref:Choline monooxygenase, chloroplastic n=1 Tax=Clonostachys byssicola TaxID=160290 RepID=A0A9N9U860_9HYPO|nr:unnamed protein product [Clonostachys byssicola]
MPSLMPFIIPVTTFQLGLSSLLTLIPLSILVSLAAKYISTHFSHKYTSPNDNIFTSTTRALPASWYRSQEIYELERRAIFSKKWILITHKLRFTENGNWVRFEEAGFQFFLIRNNKGQIKGFHNICRHRAFPIVTKEQGQSSILSCKYHAWSYSLDGRLTKAPGYNDIEGFNKVENGLFPIHVHLDGKGFIWINLNASKPEPWSAAFDKIDQMKRHEPFNFDDYHFDHTWGMSGDYNWKTLADNYNECYHCKTAHPDAAAISDLQAYKVEPKGGNIQHFANTTDDQASEGLAIVSNYYFPNACMTVSPHFFYMMRCVPTSPSHCSMEYEVYRHKDASDEEFKRIDEMFKRILSEDKWLCNNAQKNLNAGVFVNGEMHPGMEQGPLYFQSQVRKFLNEHHKLEEASKNLIWPAQQVIGKDGSITKRDMSFCTGLPCSKESEALAW